MAGYGAVRKGGAGAARSSPYGEDEAEIAQLMASLAEEHGGGDPGAAAGVGASGEVCQFFAKAGWCKFGDGCRHLHIGEASGQAPGKEPCQFFAKTGWCKWGDQCKHAHIGAATGPSDQDLMALMSSANSGAGGREVCQFFANAGWCKWGDQCKHLHTGAGAKGGAAKGGFAMKGGCGPKGGCGAVLAQVVAAAKGCGKGVGAFGGGGVVEPCQFFAQNGWCKWGDQCKHAHAGVPTAGAPGGGKGKAGAALGAVLAAAKGGWAGAGAGAKGFAGAGAGAWGAPAVANGGPQEICQFFAKTGWCKWGDQCKHRHAAAITPPPAAVMGKSAGKGMFPAAAKGGPAPPPPSSSGEACSFFAKTGWCKWGDQCKHMHIADESTPIGVQKQPCQFFAKSGWCKWGDQCKHSHIPGAVGGIEPGADAGMDFTTDALLAEISSVDFGAS